MSRGGSLESSAIVCKPIIYGSLSFFLGNKGDEGNTHRWHLYLRGIDDEDLSYLFSKVVFTLHSSFANPIRGIINIL